MENIINLNYNFKFKRIKEWFNDNYFIVVYDMNDNYITSFEDIDEPAKFFNIPLFRIMFILRNNMCIEHEHHKYKMYIYEKDRDIELNGRGKKI